MGGGASKKAFNLCELIRRDDQDEEASAYIAKANPKTFVIAEYDGRMPVVLAAELGKTRFIKQMLERDTDGRYLHSLYLDGALLANCEGQTDTGILSYNLPT